MMRLFSFLILAAVLSHTSVAKNIVIDSADGLPVPGATIFTAKGLITAITDNDGVYSAPSVDDYPLLVRALGYENLRIAAPASDTILLSAKPVELAEVTATPDSGRDVIYVQAYIREYETVIIDGDSLKSFFEGNVDYFLTDDKVKGFKDSRSPRILYNRAIIEERKDGGEKAVTRKEGTNSLFSPVINMFADFPKGLEIPARLRSLDSGSVAEEARAGQTLLVTKSPDGYVFTRDLLADKEAHEWSPSFLKLLGMTSTFTLLTRRVMCGPVESSAAFIPSYCVQGFSATTNFVSTGKMVKKACHTDSPVEFLSYVEVLPYRIDFLTVDEAKRLRKEPSVMHEVFVPEGLRPAPRESSASAPE